MRRFIWLISILASIQLLGCGMAVSGLQEVKGNSLTLEWTAPTQNEDGSDLDDLSGYRIYYGRHSLDYTRSIRVPATVTTTVVGSLGSGTYYLCITAFDYLGNESTYSNEVVITFE